MTQSEKKLPTHRHQSAHRRKRLIVALIVILSCVVVWGAFLFLSQLGPKKVNLQSSKDSNDSAETGETLVGDDQEMSAEDLHALGIELEAEAKTLAEKKDYTAASMKYQRAFELQQSINQNHPSSPQSNPGRAVRLKLEAQNAAAEPLLLNSLNLEQQADSFAKSSDLDSAVAMLHQAIAIQKRLNNEYYEARQASALRLRQLKYKLVGLESSEVHAKIEDLLKRATLLKEIRQLEAAGKLFQEAASLQEQLNKDFPDSPHASLVRVDEFRKQAQISQSALLAREIQEKYTRLGQLLAMQRIDEAEKLILQLVQTIEGFEESFPLSSLVSEVLKSKVAYLSRKKADLATIQKLVYSALIVIPGKETIHMLQTEVPQSLYALLIDANPSRNVADSNPVDSVSWIEAEAFCTRLSWILGKEVRLPTEEEFREVLSGFDSSDASNLIWSVADAKGISQSVGQKEPFPSGCFDLLGNVSEWLASEEPAESDTAAHMGGHTQDSLDEILSVPVRNLRKIDRNRLTGFRVVVLD